jgi:hypothetical protein
VAAPRKRHPAPGKPAPGPPAPGRARARVHLLDTTTPRAPLTAPPPAHAAPEPLAAGLHSSGPPLPPEAPPPRAGPRPALTRRSPPPPLQAIAEAPALLSDSDLSLAAEALSFYASLARHQPGTPASLAEQVGGG